ncbi:MAG: BrnA antitoxin family protein [Chloroflexi bacterium]|nr:BrnA antitoxin family protein [Chloroflexota bacterium]
MSESVSDSTSRTNWARVDALNDDEIDTADAPALSDDFFRRATWRRPGPVSVTVRVDPEIVAWYHAQGEEGEQRMSAALRIYAEAHRGL